MNKAHNEDLIAIRHRLIPSFDPDEDGPPEGGGAAILLACDEEMMGLVLRCLVQCLRNWPAERGWGPSREAVTAYAMYVNDLLPIHLRTRVPALREQCSRPRVA